MARTWLSLTVELVEGAGFRFCAPSRACVRRRAQALVRTARDCDRRVVRALGPRSQLWQFELAGHVYVAPEDPEWQSAESDNMLASTSRLSRLAAGDEFVYEFDLGDSWLHICRVAEGRIDPSEVLGDVPAEPTAYDGWGILPDQYLRRFADDDAGRRARDQPNRDLPPLRPWWGKPRISPPWRYRFAQPRASYGARALLQRGRLLRLLMGVARRWPAAFR